MRVFWLSFVFLFMAHSALWAQSSDNAPRFEFLNGGTHDFGTVVEDGKIETVFEFRNVGKTPLIIQDVSASCGCTTPSWSKEPVLPGKTGKITVGYDTKGRPYPFQKEIFIRSNAVVPDGKDRYEIYIKGNVVAKDKK